MKCPKCHTENPANSIKCKKCGTIFNSRKVLGLRFFSQILIIVFFALMVVGVFGPILTNIQGLLPNSEVRWDANFLYFFDGMWREVLAYKGAGTLGYGLVLTRAIVVSISCVVAIGGVLVTLFISSIKMFQAHHKNQYARLSIRKMFLYSFIPALQYLVLVRFNFYNSAYYPGDGGYLDATTTGWGGILVIIGLIAGFIAVVIEEVPQLEEVDNIGLTRYIAFRIVTCLLVVTAFVGVGSYLNYSITYASTVAPELVVYHQNVFDIVTRVCTSGDLEALRAIIARAAVAISMGALMIIALFFAIYNTFTKKRLLLWISVDLVIVCSILCGTFSQALVKEFYSGSGNICVTTLGSSTTNTIATGALAIIALGYEFLNERHGGNLFIKKED